MARQAQQVTQFMGETKDFAQVLQSNNAQIRDLAYESEVRLEWDFSEDSTKYQIVRIVMTDKDGNAVKAAVSVQELNHYLRAI